MIMIIWNINENNIYDNENDNIDEHIYVSASLDFFLKLQPISYNFIGHLSPNKMSKGKYINIVRFKELYKSFQRIFSMNRFSLVVLAKLLKRFFFSS